MEAKLAEYVGHPQKLLDSCEDQELRGEATEESYCLQMIAHITLHDNSNVRYLWKRIPDGVKTNAHVQQTWSLAKAAITRNHEEFYTLCAKPWPPILRPFIADTKHARQRKAEQNIALAYSSINLSQCSAALGLSEEETKLLLVDKMGWSFDAAKNMILPIHKAQSQKVQATGLAQLDQLSDYILHLEEKYYTDLPVDMSKFTKETEAKSED